MALRGGAGLENGASVFPPATSSDVACAAW